METLKSFILAMVLTDNHLTVEKAVSLSRLELEFQVCRLIDFKEKFTLVTCRSSKPVTCTKGNEKPVHEQFRHTLPANTAASHPFRAIPY